MAKPKVSTGAEIESALRRAIVKEGGLTGPKAPAAAPKPGSVEARAAALKSAANTKSPAVTKPPVTKPPVTKPVVKPNAATQKIRDDRAAAKAKGERYVRAATPAARPVTPANTRSASARGTAPPGKAKQEAATNKNWPSAAEFAAKNKSNEAAFMGAARAFRAKSPEEVASLKTRQAVSARITAKGGVATQARIKAVVAKSGKIAAAKAAKAAAAQKAADAAAAHDAELRAKWEAEAAAANG